MASVVDLDSLLNCFHPLLTVGCLKLIIIIGQNESNNYNTANRPSNSPFLMVKKKAGYRLSPGVVVVFLRKEAEEIL